MNSTHRIARAALAFAWIYQGLVPKILFPETGELEIFRSTGVVVLGAAQALLGVLHLVLWNSRAPLHVGLAVLGFLGVGGLITRPDLFILPFNPATLIAMMVALTAIDLTTEPKP